MYEIIAAVITAVADIAIAVILSNNDNWYQHRILVWHLMSFYSKGDDNYYQWLGHRHPAWRRLSRLSHPGKIQINERRWYYGTCCYCCYYQRLRKYTCCNNQYLRRLISWLPVWKMTYCERREIYVNSFSYSGSGACRHCHRYGKYHLHRHWQCQ